MTAFEKFKNLFGRRDTTIALPTSPFIVIDREIAIEQLKLDAKGQANGEAGYGRKLRVIMRDNKSLGDQLVTEGLARTWTGQREPWC